AARERGRGPDRHDRSAHGRARADRAHDRGRRAAAPRRVAVEGVADRRGRDRGRADPDQGDPAGPVWHLGGRGRGGQGGQGGQGRQGRQGGQGGQGGQVDGPAGREQQRRGGDLGPGHGG